MREKSCMFTGHREIPFSKTDALAALLHDRVFALAQRGYTGFICGGALGFDTLAAETVLSVRDTLPEVTLSLYLPCRDQDRYWNVGCRARYRNIISRADSVLYISESYNKYCMHERNRRMVADACICIAFLEKETGGTAYTVRHARNSGLAVMNLNDAL